MATLYEQVGDLVASGDAEAITETYQQALGIQIAHQGTCAKFQAPSLPLPSKILAGLQCFLKPRDMSQCAVSKGWFQASRLGALWRHYFQRRWPNTDEVVEDRVRGLDPELKDWFGLYRQRHCMSEPRYFTVFLDSLVNMQVQGQNPQACRAVADHHHTGIGWDSYLKHRAGWSVGSVWARHDSSWLQDDKIDWNMVPAFFSHVFRKLSIRAPDHCAIVPVLPAVWSTSSQARLARILSARFEVPKVHIVPATLCTLLAHKVSSGMVVWRNRIGVSMICCFHDGKEIARSKGFCPVEYLPSDIAALLHETAENLDAGTKSEVLRHVVVMRHNAVSKEEEQNRKKARQDTFHRHEREETDDPVSSTAEIPLIKDCCLDLSASCFSRTEFHASTVLEEVMTGADVLATLPDLLAQHELACKEEACWEWRYFADNGWQRLPAYVSGVLEGALRDGKRYAPVQMIDLGNYLFADLHNFSVVSAELTPRARFNRKSLDDEDIAKDFNFEGQERPLTRFLRGRPSCEADRRTPEQLQQQFRPEVVEVERIVDADAITVSTLTGKVAYSASKHELRPFQLVQDLLEEVSKSVHVPAQQLALLLGDEKLVPTTTLQVYLAMQGSLELQLLISQAPPPKPQDGYMQEMIPEDVPGESWDVCSY
jgi:hypothetical protein